MSYETQYTLRVTNWPDSDNPALDVHTSVWSLLSEHFDHYEGKPDVVHITAHQIDDLTAMELAFDHFVNRGGVLDNPFSALIEILDSSETGEIFVYKEKFVQRA